MRKNVKNNYNIKKTMKDNQNHCTMKHTEQQINKNIKKTLKTCNKH